MNFNFTKLSTYEKSVLAGLYLSKFDSTGVNYLGFSSFIEAFNTIGLALSTKPSSIKNYRDEFDPYFANARQGWSKRQMQDDRRRLYEAFKDLSLEPFADVLRQAIYKNHDLDLMSENAARESGDEDENSFAKRLLTGQAAEKYFEVVHPSLPMLADYSLEDVTGLGCGFDFRLRKSGLDDFLAVEVKGLNDSRGTISLTEKEHRIAGVLSNRFFLFVVRNFREKPFHTIYCNPLKSGLIFSRQETQIIQVNWRVSI